MYAEQFIPSNISPNLFNNIKTINKLTNNNNNNNNNNIIMYIEYINLFAKNEK